MRFLWFRLHSKMTDSVQSFDQECSSDQLYHVSHDSSRSNAISSSWLEWWKPSGQTLIQRDLKRQVRVDYRFVANNRIAHYSLGRRYQNLYGSSRMWRMMLHNILIASLLPVVVTSRGARDQSGNVPLNCSIQFNTIRSLFLSDHSRRSDKHIEHWRNDLGR